MEITSKTPPPKVPMRPEAELFDLIGVIRTWAINAFVASADSKTRKQVSITGKGVGNLGVEIVWDDIVCWSEPPRYDDEKSVEIPKCHALFSTVYRNGTDGVQEYNFRTDRSTRSTAEIEITKGFNAHREIGVKLQEVKSDVISGSSHSFNIPEIEEQSSIKANSFNTLPEQILEASAGFSQEISLSKATRQSVDEEMSWGIDAQVEVKPKSIANVQVNVIEKEMNWKFTVNTHLRGRIRAICTDRKRNNAFLMNIESDLGDVVKAHLENLQSPSAKKPTNVNVERTSKTVIITTEGKCAFRFGVKQEVDVTQVEANYPIITTN